MATRHPINEPWSAFLAPAAEWLISYAEATRPLFSVSQFVVAHSLELHLKACHAKAYGDVKLTIKKSHHFEQLWRELQGFDPTFMSSFDIDFGMLTLQSTMNDQEISEHLGSERYAKYVEHAELLQAFNYAADLKYFGSFPKRHPRTSVVGSTRSML